MKWNKAQKWESEWWGDCLNTLGEDLKQVTYAKRMGLDMIHNGKSPYNIDLNNKSVVDIGGGPTSLLLKCLNRGDSVVVDPLHVPKWVKDRYKFANIDFQQISGEDFKPKKNYDEVWIYNCLQHTQDPEFIIQNAKQYTKLIRIFEWVETGTNEGHPHTFTKEILDTWLGGYGQVEVLKENNCYGKCYYGIFPI